MHLGALVCLSDHTFVCTLLQKEIIFEMGNTARIQLGISSRLKFDVKYRGSFHVCLCDPQGSEALLSAYGMKLIHTAYKKSSYYVCS